MSSPPLSSSKSSMKLAVVKKAANRITTMKRTQIEKRREMRFSVNRWLLPVT